MIFLFKITKPDDTVVFDHVDGNEFVPERPWTPSEAMELILDRVIHGEYTNMAERLLEYREARRYVVTPLVAF